MSDMPPPPPRDPKASRAEAKADAKASAARSKAMRPWYKKKRFILLGALALIVVVVVASSGGSGDGNRPSPSDPVQATDGAAPGALPTDPSVTAKGQVVVDLAAEHQTVDGFGVSARVWSDEHLTGAPGREVPASARREVLRLLYEDLGLTRERSVLDTGIQPVKPDGDPGTTDLAGFDFSGKGSDDHIERVEAARAFGLSTFFAAPVYLEEWMARTDTAEYVEWAMTLLRHWRDAGVEPPYYSPVNEPALRADRSATWLRDVVRDLGRQLRAEGFGTLLVIPDDLNPTEAYARAEVVLADPEARPYVGAIGYHLYGGAEGDEARLAELARTYDLPLWMTEFAPGGADSWPSALEWASRMQHLLTEFDVSAIDYMWGFFGAQDDNALISLRFAGDRYEGFDVQPMFDAIGQFSRFIRPGAVRVDTAGGGDGRISAFKGRDDELVVVAVNPHNEPRRVRVEVANGALTGSVRGTRSGDAGSQVPVEASDASSTGFTVDLDPGSVTTMVADLDG